MIVYFAISLLLILAYGVLMLDIFGHWNEQVDHKIPENYLPSVFLSIVIPARNEANNIVQCIESILNNNYPSDLFEILVVDDHSEDSTSQVVNALNNKSVHLLKLAQIGNTGKKQAIEYAISKSRGDIILITDADCIVNTNWLRFHSSFYEINDAKCVTGPIRYTKATRLIEQFQSLDLTGMMGVTQAGIFSDKWYMANGANMSFLKKQFYEVGSFDSSRKYASGDDVFLIQAIADMYGQDVYFLKNPEAAVTTEAETSWNSLYQQRLRWGTKNKAYKKKAISFTLGLVFIFCFSILLNLALIPFFGLTALFVFLTQLVSKLFIDYFYLQKLNSYFNSSKSLESFIPSSVLYILYIVWMGIASIFLKNYIWKGRKLN